MFERTRDAQTHLQLLFKTTTMHDSDELIQSLPVQFLSYSENRNQQQTTGYKDASLSAAFIAFIQTEACESHTNVSVIHAYVYLCSPAQFCSIWTAISVLLWAANIMVRKCFYALMTMNEFGDTDGI